MLTAETAILEKLKAKIDGAKLIASSAAVAGTLDMAALCPAVIVHPGEATPQANHDGTKYKELQTWKVVVCQKLVANTESRDTTYQEAATFLRQVVDVLAGLQLDEKEFRPLTYSHRPEPVVNQGYVEFELQFTTVFTF